MKIDMLRCTCQKCKTVFEAEIVVEAPVDVATASLLAIRCPKCGSRKCGIGGGYDDAPPVSAPIADRIRWWSMRGERGTSSNTIYAVLAQGSMPFDWRHDIPYDPADYRQCHQLLELVPEWRPRLEEVAAVYPYWKPFVDSWPAMEALWAEESKSRTGRAPKLLRTDASAGRAIAKTSPHTKGCEMTDITKKVTRRTGIEVRDGAKRRRLIVTLYAAGIGIRPEKTRREEFVTLESVYALAIRLRVRGEKGKKRCGSKRS